MQFRIFQQLGHLLARCFFSMSEIELTIAALI